MGEQLRYKFYRSFLGMLIVESIAKIRRMYQIDAKAIREIARDLNISKNTVKKVIRSDATNVELATYERKKPVIGDYLEKLGELLNANQNEPVRRKMTAKKFYEELRKLGYKGGYQAVNLLITL